ncbi:MAG: hypothetical protein ACRC1Z_21100, partial [Waterburya sp.]
DSYAFDLGRDNAEKLLEYWLDMYHANWIRLATIEALYLGRYKAISVEQILNVWLRIGTPNPHFTYEFERLICRKLPNHLWDLSDLTATAFKADPINLYQSESAMSVLTQQAESSSVSTPVKRDRLNLAQTFNNFNNSVSSQAKVSLMAHWGLSCHPIWSDFTTGSKIIHQFIPLPDVSSFFTKLKTFGEDKSTGQ